MRPTRAFIVVAVTLAVASAIYPGTVPLGTWSAVLIINAGLAAFAIADYLAAPRHGTRSR